METPAYIREKGLQPDYEYYIQHQLMNPISQLFGIFVERIPGYQAPAVWEEDVTYQKEKLAADLLFKEGLDYCRQTSKRLFVGMLAGGAGGGAAAGKVAAAAVKRRTPKMSRVTGDPSLTKEVATFKTQTMITSFLKQSASFSDEYAIKQAQAKKKKPVE